MIKSLNRWKFIKYTLAVFNLLASMSSIIGLFYTIYEKSINNKTAWIWGFGDLALYVLLLY